MQVAVVDYKSKNAGKELTDSFIHTGFAVLKNHSIDKAEVDNLYSLWQAFFDSKEKYDYMFDEEKQDGFFPFEKSETAVGAEVPDLKEFYHAYTWGRLPENLREPTLSMYHQLDSLACDLLELIEEHTPEKIRKGFSVPLKEMVRDNPRTLFRILHYPPLPESVPAGAVRAAPHEDINLITLLLAATDSGLQVKDSQGNWLDVPCEHGMIAINIADMLQLASNYYYKSTTHRVINPVGEAAKRSRLSMPLFLHARDEVKLSPEKTATEYRMERLREIGLVES